MKTRSLVFGLVLLAAVAGVILVITQSSLLQQLGLANSQSAAKGKGKGKQQTAGVHVKLIESRNVTPRQTIVGTVRPRRIANVGSAASGRVDAFLVNEGDWVEPRAKIAQLKTALIKAERDAAEAVAEARDAELERLQLSLPEEIKQAEAALAKHSHLEKYLIAKLDRTVRLAVGQAVSQEEIDQTKSLVQQTAAARREAEANLAMLSKTKNAKIREAEAKKKTAQAEFQRLDEQMKRHTIVAPFAGYIVKEHTEAGEWLQQGGLVATIAELSFVEIEVPVLEDYISYIKVNEIVPVEVPALPPGRRKFKGKVAHIVRQANVKTQTFPVKIWVENPLVSLAPNYKDRLLMADMLARVQLPAGLPKKNAVMAPLDAINLERDSRTIFVVIPDPENPQKTVVKPAAVKLGVSDGNWIEVFGDVKPGQRVVTEGNERLRPFQQVQIIEKASPIK